MSIERPDVKFRLDHEKHELLKVFARLDGLKLHEWVERVVNEKLDGRVGEATVAAAELQRLGILGKSRELSGKPK